MILHDCPRCNRKVVARQVTRTYQYSDNRKAVHNLDQIICNICGVTVAIITQEKSLLEDLDKIHKLIRSQISPPAYVNFR